MNNESATDLATYAPHARVAGRVTRVNPFLVFVEVAPGVTGVIRRREWDWVEPTNLQEIVHVDDQVEAIVLNTDERRHQLNLSHKRVKGDPWVNAEVKYSVGSVHTGTVANCLAYGTFVELEPGLVGLLHRSEVPDWAGDTIIDVLWVGDVVKVQVTALDVERQRLALSIKEFLAGQQAAEGAPKTKRTTMAVAEQLDQIWQQSDDGATLITRPGSAQIQQILIIADDQEPYGPLASWLKKQGYTADTTDFGEGSISIDDAIAFGYDLVFAEASRGGATSVEAVRRIQRARSGTRVVLMGGLDWDSRDLDWQDLQVTDVLLKPLDYREIAQLLQDIEWQRLGRRPSPQSPGDKNLDFIQAISAPIDTGYPLQKTLEGMLQELCRQTGATAGFVFEMDPVTREMSVIAQVGNVKTREQARPELKFSPVKDVIQGHEHLHEDDAPRNARAKFRKLLSFVEFRSCIGLPIDMPSHSVDYGLFIIHSEPRRFNKSHDEQARLASILMKPAIERKRLEAQTQVAQAFLLGGQLSLGMAHEIGNKLSGIEGHVANLEACCTQLKSCPDPTADIWREIAQRLKEIRNLDSELRDLIHGYLGLMRGDRSQQLDLHEILRRSGRELERLAHNNKVQIKFELRAEAAQTMAVEAWLQQVFLNVMLNAIQQIAERRASGGTLTVRTEYQPDSLLPFKIHFQDDGPGIHAQHLERIYELGFSTKKEGVGLGLFISRGLIESLGGKISVEESIMLIGTTLLIELPVKLKEGEMQ